MGSETPTQAFDANRARRFRPNAAFAKTAILVELADDEAATVLKAPFGEQTLQGAFYLVAEGEGSYGAARAEFERIHEQIGPNQWAKRESVRGYQATERCMVETYVGAVHEATVSAQPGDWIVQQATGEVMVITPGEFAARYEAVGEQPT